MFAIDVRFEKTHPDSLIAEIQNAYLSGMSLNEAEEQFDDYFPCVEAAIALAIDKGWNLDSVIAKNMQYIYEYFYNEDDLCGDIVADAMKYLHDAQSLTA